MSNQALATLVDPFPGQDSLKKVYYKNLLNAIIQNDFNSFRSIILDGRLQFNPVNTAPIFIIQKADGGDKALNLRAIIGYLGRTDFMNFLIHLNKADGKDIKRGDYVYGASYNPNAVHLVDELFEKHDLTTNHIIAQDFLKLLQEKNYPLMGLYISKGFNPLQADVTGMRAAILLAADQNDVQALKIMARSPHFAGSTTDITSIDGCQMQPAAKQNLIPFLKWQEDKEKLYLFKDVFKPEFDDIKKLAEKQYGLRAGQKGLYRFKGYFAAALTGDFNKVVKHALNKNIEITKNDLYTPHENGLCVMDYVRDTGDLEKIFSEETWKKAPLKMVRFYKLLESDDQFRAKDAYTKTYRALPTLAVRFRNITRTGEKETVGIRRRPKPKL